MALMVKKQLGGILEWIYRVFSVFVLGFTLSYVLFEHLFFYRYFIFSRQTWEWLAPIVVWAGVLSILLYYVLLWFYPKPRPWWDRLLIILVVFSLIFFNPLRKG